MLTISRYLANASPAGSVFQALLTDENIEKYLDQGLWPFSQLSISELLLMRAMIEKFIASDGAAAFNLYEEQGRANPATDLKLLVTKLGERVEQLKASSAGGAS